MVFPPKTLLSSGMVRKSRGRARKAKGNFCNVVVRRRLSPVIRLEPVTSMGRRLKNPELLTGGTLRTEKSDLPGLQSKPRKTMLENRDSPEVE